MKLRLHPHTEKDITTGINGVLHVDWLHEDAVGMAIATQIIENLRDDRILRRITTEEGANPYHWMEVTLVSYIGSWSNSPSIPEKETAEHLNERFLTDLVFFIRMMNDPQDKTRFTMSLIYELSRKKTESEGRVKFGTIKAKLIKTDKSKAKFESEDTI